MRCPYCAEDVKDDALVCKHCQRELFVVKPLLKKISDLEARLAALEPAVAPAMAEAVAPAHSHRAPHRTVRGLSPLEAILAAYVVLVVIHYVFIVQLDVRLLFYQFTSIAVPLVFGAISRQSHKALVSVALLCGAVIAVAATATELATIAVVDKVSFWPKGGYEWREVGMHCASIAFGFLTGAIVRDILIGIYVPHAKMNSTVDWAARFIMDQFGDGKNKMTLKTMRSMVSSLLGFVSAVISIATGLWEYLLKN